MKEIKLDTKGPEVSIVVPVYNGEKFLSQCLSSLTAQTYRDIEIIVVDDGSTDNTPAIVDKFSFFRNLTYIKKENGGTGSALNVGHGVARGKYITWCSADNVYFPPFVETFIKGFTALEAQNAPVELVYSDFCYISEDGKRIQDVLHKQPQKPKDLIQGYDIGMSFMYTKALWEKTGGYWNRICEDYHWCVRAAQHTNFALIQGVLAAFRVHGGQLTGSNAVEEKAAADDCRELAQALFGNK
jgi:glycosyltransferase involved in cell wall biosynthesis